MLIRRLGQGSHARVDVYLADGSLTSLGEDVPEGSLLLSLAREVRARVIDEALGRSLVEHGYLEGDFVLRSGKRSTFYFDKFRFETQPDVLEALGRRLSAAVEEHEPEAVRLACPVLGAVVLAASASIASRLPFVIVRDEAKEYGTANRIEGAFEAGDRVCLIEDVVTSGGALSQAVGALREAGLECRTAVLRRRPRRGRCGRARARRSEAPSALSGIIVA